MAAAESCCCPPSFPNKTNIETLRLSKSMKRYTQGLFLVLLACFAAPVNAVWRETDGSTIELGSEVWTTGDSSLVSVSVDRNRNYRVMMKGKEWLRSSPPSVHLNSTCYSDGDASAPLRFEKMLKTEGEDPNLGKFEELEMMYTIGDTSIPVSFAIQFYADSSNGLFLFQQRFPEGLQATNVLDWDSDKVFQGSNEGHKQFMVATKANGDERTVNWPAVGQFAATGKVSVEFPAFLPGRDLPQSLHHLTWMGRFAVGRWGEGFGAPGGQEGGPYVLFKGKEQSRHALVISPFDNFKTNILGYDCAGGAGICAGPQGYVKQLPKGFVATFSISASLDGPTDAMLSFGETLKKAHATARMEADKDILTSHLSYWTDNGAYYSWYNFENILAEGTPEEVLAQLHKEFEQMRVPVAYTQLDAYWFDFERENANCKKNVVEQSKLFPSGLEALAATLKTKFLVYDGPTCASFEPPFSGVEMMASNRYNLTWASGQLANVHPDHADSFYRYLMNTLKKKGAAGYEIDFMDFNYLLFEKFNTDPLASHSWLQAMGNAAEENGLPVQYCMSLPSDLLESVLHGAVTNARASHDYQAGGDNWNIGPTSLLHTAVGLKPSKDNFRTSFDTGATNGPLNALIATLSTGPVGFSDKLGTAHYELLKKTCRADGRLLQPSTPPLPIDRTYQTGFQGHLWAASTSLDSNTWYQILAVETANPHEELDVSELYPRPSPNQTFAVWERGEEACKEGLSVSACVSLLTSHAPTFNVYTGTQEKEDMPIRYKSWVAAPVVNGYALLGEHEKLVPVSVNRVKAIKYLAEGLKVTVSGAQHEYVSMLFLTPSSKLVVQGCFVPQTLECEISVS